MKIFLTGSTGFIGRNLKEYLEEKYTVFSPTHKELELINSEDVSNYFSTQGPFDVVIHTAVKGSNKEVEGVSSVYEDNMKIFNAILSCSDHFKKMIFLGSGAEYDKSQSIVQVKEEDFGKSIPQDEYGRYKYDCSKIIEESKLDIVNLRLFGVFGPHESYTTRFISNAICRSLLDMNILIKNNNVVFDYLYIKDLFPIIEYFIKQKSAHKFYNVGTGESIDLISIATKIKHLTGDSKDITVTNPVLGNEYTCNIRRLYQEIKDLSFTPYDQAIQELVSWYQLRLGEIDHESL